jgi:hypothetical protein
MISAGITICPVLLGVLRTFLIRAKTGIAMLGGFSGFNDPAMRFGNGVRFGHVIHSLTSILLN